MYKGTVTWADGTHATVTGKTILDVAARVEGLLRTNAPVSYKIEPVQEDKENGIHSAEH